jgi:hypothetical protein
VVYRKERGVYSLLDIDTKRANLTNLTNLTNFPNFPNFPNQTDIPSFVSPEDQKLGKVSFEGKNELTIPAQNLQGLQEKVSLVSKVSLINQVDIKSSDPNQTPSFPFDTKSDGTPDKTKEPSEEEEVVYLLMPQDRACENCKCEVWVIKKTDLGKRSGWGKCAKCGHISFLGDLSKGKVLDDKADVEFFLMDLPM